MKRIFDAANQEEHTALLVRDEVAKFIRLDGLELFVVRSEALWPATYVLLLTDGYSFAQERVIPQVIGDKSFASKMAAHLICVWAHERYSIKS